MRRARARARSVALRALRRSIIRHAARRWNPRARRRCRPGEVATRDRPARADDGDRQPGRRRGGLEVARRLRDRRRRQRRRGPRPSAGGVVGAAFRGVMSELSSRDQELARELASPTLRSGFLASARRHADATALRRGQREWSYCEAEEIARRWAARLYDAVGARPQRVAIFATRS